MATEEQFKQSGANSYISLIAQREKSLNKS